MKHLFTYFILIFAIFMTLPQSVEARGGHSSRSYSSKSGSVHVKGYTKKNGTYVAPHYRSSPNRTKADNWSHKGNVNPYTGEVGTKDN